jgi:hypothetical protein
MPPTGHPAPGTRRRWGSSRKAGYRGGWELGRDDPRDLLLVWASSPVLALHLSKSQIPQPVPSREKVAAEVGTARV